MANLRDVFSKAIKDDNIVLVDSVAELMVRMGTLNLELLELREYLEILESGHSAQEKMLAQKRESSAVARKIIDGDPYNFLEVLRVSVLQQRDFEIDNDKGKIESELYKTNKRIGEVLSELRGLHF